MTAAIRLLVIMPHSGDRLAAAKLRVLREEAERCGVIVHLPHHSGADNQFDLAETLRRIRDSSLVLADLSLARPSCYYELALAESSQAAVFAIATAGTEVHQAVSRNTVRYYKSLEEYRALARNALEQISESSPNSP